MFGDNAYSTLVAWMKIILPLIALGLLSTLFLFARSSDGEGEIPYAEIEDVAREQRLSEPYFAGVADDGSVVSVSAADAKPSTTDNNVLDVTALRADLVTTGGVTVAVSAGDATLNTADQVAQLTGLARVISSNGYQMETFGLTAFLQQGRIESAGALEVRAPFGQLQAGRLVIETPQGAEGQRMTFTDGVRLLYDPQSEG